VYNQPINAQEHPAGLETVGALAKVANVQFAMQVGYTVFYSVSSRVKHNVLSQAAYFLQEHSRSTPSAPLCWGCFCFQQWSDHWQKVCVYWWIMV